MSTVATKIENSVVLERVFNAPRELVFKAWTEPERLAQWWGPRKFTNPVCRVDARVGGEIYVDMRSPDGVVYPMTGQFTEVKSPERLVFTTAALDAAGNEMFSMQHVVEFRQLAEGTAVRVESKPTVLMPQAERFLAGHRAGYTQSLDKLTEMLSGGRRMVTTRLFDAPRELVYSMWTDAEHIGNWWGPRGFATTTSVMDLRPGGDWIHVMHGPDGRDYPNHVVYVEIAKPERLVYYQISDPGFRAYVTFLERGASTEVHFEMEFVTAALRDQVINEFGAAQGQEDTMTRLGEWLAKVK